MKINTLFFGITRDLVGASELRVYVEENSSIKNFKSILKEMHPNLEKIDSYAIAVNEEYAQDNFILNKGDVVAIIPPVSGG